MMKSKWIKACKWITSSYHGVWMEFWSRT